MLFCCNLALIMKEGRIVALSRTCRLNTVNEQSLFYTHILKSKISLLLYRRRLYQQDKKNYAHIAIQLLSLV